MVLKNKDGTPYRLQKPNPVMKNQSLWTGEKFALHNMNWAVEIKSEENHVEPIHSDLNIKDDFVAELSETKKEPEPVFERKTVVLEDAKRIEEEKKPDINKTFIHVLPAIMQTKIDDLYGDVIKTIKYESPTSFEGVVIQSDDLSFHVWTDSDNFGEGSVLFPKTNTKRWWRIKSKEKKADGVIIKCIPSDYQPSF